MNREELIRENERLKTQIRERSYSSNIGVAIRTLGYVSCFFFFYLCVKELAGLTTVLDADVDVGTNFDAKVNFGGINKFIFIYAVCASLFGLAGFVYGKLQKAAREKAIMNLHPNKLREERLLDSDRSSSDLEIDGKTRIEDKI